MKHGWFLKGLDFKQSKKEKFKEMKWRLIKEIDWKVFFLLSLMK